MNYKKIEGIYYINNIKFSETKTVGKDNGEAIIHQANKELFVININTSNVVPFADSLLFKSTRFSSIRHYKDHYNFTKVDNKPKLHENASRLCMP